MESKRASSVPRQKSQKGPKISKISDAGNANFLSKFMNLLFVAPVCEDDFPEISSCRDGPVHEYVEGVSVEETFDAICEDLNEFGIVKLRIDKFKNKASFSKRDSIAVSSLSLTPSKDHYATAFTLLSFHEI